MCPPARWIALGISCAAASLAGCHLQSPPFHGEHDVNSSSDAAPAPVPIELTDSAMRIHRACLLFDGHNDLPDKIRNRSDSAFQKLDLSQHQPELHTDIARLRQGGVGAQFWSAYVPAEKARTGGAARHALEQIDLIHRMVRRYPDDFEFAYSADDVERIHANGRIASLIGLEGGHAIENSLGVLRTFYILGVRYITLTHSDTHDWADSATDKPQHGGLSPFGQDVIREMNRLGILVDISHVSLETMKDVLRITEAPVIASHSSAYALAAHPRNIPDDVLRLVAENDGVVMVNFFSGFVTRAGAQTTLKMFDEFRRLRAKHPGPEDLDAALGELREKNKSIERGSVHTIVDHIEHIARVAGIDHVGLGSDYDGVTVLPVQLENVSCYPFITQELLNRGHSEPDIHKILGQNVLRALRQAEQVARDLKD